MSILASDKAVNFVSREEEKTCSWSLISWNNDYKNILFRSAKPKMSSKILVRWLVGAGDVQISELTKNPEW